MTETAVHVSRVHTVAVPVADQDRALAFYRGTLGFEIRRDSTFGDGQRRIEVAPASPYLPFRGQVLSAYISTVES